MTVTTGKEPRSVDYERRHLQFGWWSLLLFLLLGLALETMHGFKVGLYLDVPNETRRLMWTLAHAHGALLGIVHVIFGLSVTRVGLAERGRRTASLSLVAATVLLPGGFFLGGVSVYGGDPGAGIALAPVGAAALVVAVFLVARSAGRPADAGAPGAGGKRRR